MSVFSETNWPFQKLIVFPGVMLALEGMPNFEPPPPKAKGSSN